MMWLLLASLIFAPERPARADLIELNSLYDDGGRLVLEQWIVWQWQTADGRYHVRDWAMATAGKLRSHRSGYRLTIRQGPSLFEVIAPDYRRTWTQLDPETSDRAALAPAARSAIWSRSPVVPPDEAPP